MFTHDGGTMVMFGDTFGEPVDVIRAPYWRVFEFEGGQSQRVTCAYKGRVNPPSQPNAKRKVSAATTLSWTPTATAIGIRVTPRPSEA